VIRISPVVVCPRGDVNWMNGVGLPYVVIAIQSADTTETVKAASLYVVKAARLSRNDEKPRVYVAVGVSVAASIFTRIEEVILACPTLAVIATSVVVVTRVVVMSKLPFVAPEGIVSDDGVVTATLFAARPIVTPGSGATSVNVTVPCAT